MERGESRLPPLLALATALLLQVLLPDDLVVLRPRYLLPGLEFAVLLPLVLGGGTRLTAGSRELRAVALTLLVLIALTDAVQLGGLVRVLLFGTGPAVGSPGRELIRGASQVWLTNMVVFAVAYWQIDQGGPHERLRPGEVEADFRFTQQGDEPRPDGTVWLPAFVDYLFLSFTNQTAFSPTDTMPLTPRAKVLMMVQGIASLVTVTVVAARAVNVLT